ncbi:MULTISPECIES: carbohydrate ABC transporter permease [Streptomyces]|uniref:Sugar ABC transporter permease n=1 Tax=Streptomyces acidicola TaxID=2596892 RepID=A0A5N8WST9_9ACTN|nr:MULTISPECIES: sugar ABC transporter permease [Streptomyces]MBA2810216.1 sugar ABC transporter permease [Streptomyces sp. KM273126]MPY50471.1 sugar ABC transporter permease [Streptomyces acidicola]
MSILSPPQASPHAAAVEAAPETRRQRRRGNLTGLLFAVPALILLGVFHVWASVFNVAMSLTDWSLGGASFVGLRNYLELVGSAEFQNSLVVTLFFVVGTVPVTILLALPIAYALQYRLAKFHLYRVLVFTPYVVPTVASAMVWGVIFGSNQGSLANWILSWFGADPRQWLVDGTGVLNLLLEPLGVRLPGLWAGPSVALCVAMLAQIWHMLGFAVIVLLSGLAGIGEEVREAARMDGAGEFRILRSVVVPLLSPTILFLAVISLIFAVREFNIIYVLTGGGPQGSSETLSMLMVRQFYEDNELGRGATTGTFLALSVAALTLVQFWISRKRVHYE